MPFNILFALLPPLVSGIIVALLPALWVVVYQVLCALQDKPLYKIEPLQREITDIFKGKGLFMGVDMRLIALILVFCTIFGLMYFMQTGSVITNDPLGQNSSVGVVSVRGITAAVFLIAALTVFRDKMKLLFTCCFYILIAGVAVMIVGIFVPEFRAMSPLMVAIGYCGFDILVWTMIAFHGYVSPNFPAKTVCVTMLAEQAGIGLGILLGLVIQALDFTVTVETGVMMALNILAVAVLVAYTEYGSRLWTLLIKTSLGSEQAVQKATNEDAPGLDALASRYGLTEREVEILTIFAQGRSMAYIAEKLYVSENTVKTHIRHIYTKCEVHNKQEMIDLVHETQGKTE
ncbi:MAG: hypothetical protein IKE43_09660 [Coriobacteriales bacterium]|nr:hypothetical protein [Coriobacteriales bacterium]